MSKCAYCQEDIHQACVFYVNGDDCDCMDNDHMDEEELAMLRDEGEED